MSPRESNIPKSFWHFVITRMCLSFLWRYDSTETWVPISSETSQVRPSQRASHWVQKRLWRQWSHGRPSARWLLWIFSFSSRFCSFLYLQLDKGMLVPVILVIPTHFFLQVWWTVLSKVLVIKIVWFWIRWKKNTLYHEV